jgi:hypothetical protein
VIDLQPSTFSRKLAIESVLARKPEMLIRLSVPVPHIEALTHHQIQILPKPYLTLPCFAFLADITHKTIMTSADWPLVEPMPSVEPSTDLFDGDILGDELMDIYNAAVVGGGDDDDMHGKFSMVRYR